MRSDSAGEKYCSVDYNVFFVTIMVHAHWKGQKGKIKNKKRKIKLRLEVLIKKNQRPESVAKFGLVVIVLKTDK